MQQPDLNADRHEEASPPSEPSPPVRAEVRYEHTDVVFRRVLIVAVLGCAVGAGVFFLVRVFYRASLESRTDRQSTAFAPLEKPMSQLPPEPRLELLDRMEKTPASNVSKWERGEEKALETYGPADQKGFVRIPLQRAMQLLADHVPVRKAADRPKFKDRGLIDAGESNSGRMFRGVSK